MTLFPSGRTADLVALVRTALGLAVAAVLGASAVTLFDVLPRELRAAAVVEEPRPTIAVQLLTDQEKANFIRQYEAMPKVSVPIDAGGAKVLVVKFNDFQCPPCRQSYLDYKWAIAKYQALGQLKFVLKHFPLERECNAAVSRDLHVASCEAAAAMVMAQSRRTADKLEEWFFANQPSLSAERVRQAAATVAGITDFDAQYARALALVKSDAALGAQLGAKSTPTFLINGRVVAGALPAAYFELAIEHELTR